MTEATIRSLIVCEEHKNQERTLSLNSSFSVKRRLARVRGWEGGLDSEIKVDMSENLNFRQLVSL